MTTPRFALFREFVMRWKWLILSAGGILFALTVILPQIGAFEWITLIPALAVFLVVATNPEVKYRRLYGLGLVFFWPFYAVNFHWFFYMYPLDFAGMTRGASAVVVLVACRLDMALGSKFIRDAAIIGFIANEVISITENAGLMGVPIPAALVKAIEILKKNSEGE